MNPIDPALPAQLRWAASKVDAIVGDPFWKAKFWERQAIGGGNIGASWYTVGDSWASNVWVGRAASAHNQELEAARSQIEFAHRQLMMLRDELERQATAAAAQIEAQQLIDQLTNLLRQF